MAGHGKFVVLKEEDAFQSEGWNEAFMVHQGNMW